MKEGAGVPRRSRSALDEPAPAIGLTQCHERLRTHEICLVQELCSEERGSGFTLRRSRCRAGGLRRQRCRRRPPVAATVSSQDIMEQTVTDYIANFRTSSSLESDEHWGEWMVANGYTPESVREEVIDYYVNQDLYDQAAKEYNVTVEQADIDSAMEETKAMFESDEAFQEALGRPA